MMKKLIILAGLLVSLQVNAHNYAKQWCADNGDEGQRHISRKHDKNQTNV